MKYLWLLLILTVTGASCNLYKEVEVVEVLDVKMGEWTEDAVYADVYLQLKNPNWYKVKLTESHVQLYLDGKEIGIVELGEKLEIPKQSVTTQTMHIKADYDAMENVMGNVLSLLFKTKFVVEGKGYVKGRAFFVARKVPVEFKQDLTREDLGLE
jgi:LEA14-like dessication related protein